MDLEVGWCAFSKRHGSWDRLPVIFTVIWTRETVTSWKWDAERHNVEWLLQYAWSGFDVSLLSQERKVANDIISTAGGNTVRRSDPWFTASQAVFCAVIARARKGGSNRCSLKGRFIPRAHDKSRQKWWGSRIKITKPMFTHTLTCGAINATGLRQALQRCGWRVRFTVRPKPSRPTCILFLSCGRMNYHFW
jgi:hypothetical protein